MKSFRKAKQPERLSRYAGQWVALLNDRVVAAEKNISDLMIKVKEKRIKKHPIVFLVPRKEEGPYILIFL